MLKKAIELAKGNEEPKIGLSVQVPKSLKDDFENICKSNNVSMSSMLLSLIQVVVDESQEKDRKVEAIDRKIFHLTSEQKTLQKIYTDTGIEELKMEDGTIRYIKKELDEINKQIESLENDIHHIIYEI